MLNLLAGGLLLEDLRLNMIKPQMKRYKRSK